MFFEPNRRTTPSGFFVPSCTLRHVADVDRLAVAPGDDHPLHLLGRAKLPQRADDIPPLSLPDIAPGCVLILVGQGQPEVFDRELPGGQQLRIDDHLQFVLAATDEVGPGHAVHPFEPGLDLVLRQPLDRLDVDRGGHQRGDLGMGGGQLSAADRGPDRPSGP